MMDKKKCPICGNNNGCAIVNRENPRDCWCVKVVFPELPKMDSCICEECLNKIKKDGTMAHEKHI